MNVSDPHYAERTRASFARQPAMATLGVTIAEVGPGRVVLAMAHRGDLTQQHGFMHAGTIATALDSACGYAAFTLMPAEAGVLTIEFKINLLAPARGPVIRMTGRVTKAGRTISVVDGQAVQPHPRDPSQTQIVATMTATVMTISGREDVRG